jgi:hypothetical protein
LASNNLFCFLAHISNFGTTWKFTKKLLGLHTLSVYVDCWPLV